MPTAKYRFEFREPETTLYDPITVAGFWLELLSDCTTQSTMVGVWLGGDDDFADNQGTESC
jgi:hypothetical protein